MSDYNDFCLDAATHCLDAQNLQIRLTLCLSYISVKRIELLSVNNIYFYLIVGVDRYVLFQIDYELYNKKI